MNISKLSYKLIRNLSASCLMILCSFHLSSCSGVEMVDSSSNSTYSYIIGKKFKLKEDAMALGISESYRLPADYIYLIIGFRYSGRAVVSEQKLQKDTIVKVVKVLTAKSIFLTRVEYLVREINTNQLKGEEIRVSLVGKSDDANYGLNSNYYEIVD